MTLGSGLKQGAVISTSRSNCGGIKQEEKDPHCPEGKPFLVLLEEDLGTHPRTLHLRFCVFIYIS